MKKIVLFTVIGLLFFSHAYSADINQYLDGPTGASVSFNDDGTIKSIFSTGEAELLFGDAKDVRSAKQKAKMRAKASIAKFLTERISSEEVVEEMTKTASETSSGQTSAVRNSLTVQTETIRNSAETMLKGVVVLGEDVNHDDKVVRILVGFNNKTMRAADSAKSQLKTDTSSGQKGGNGSYGSYQTGSGRQVKVSPNAMDF
jgi:hypothetical protein